MSKISRLRLEMTILGQAPSSLSQKFCCLFWQFEFLGKDGSAQPVFAKGVLLSITD